MGGIPKPSGNRSCFHWLGPWCTNTQVNRVAATEPNGGVYVEVHCHRLCEFRDCLFSFKGAVQKLLQRVVQYARDLVLHCQWVGFKIANHCCCLLRTTHRVRRKLITDISSICSCQLRWRKHSGHGPIQNVVLAPVAKHPTVCFLHRLPPVDEACLQPTAQGQRNCLLNAD